MALFLPGPGVAVISGSVGGTTFTRNRSGMVMRNRSMPVNPNTTRQNEVRDNMSAVVAEWLATLTPAERDQWGVYAAAIARTNRVGQQIFHTGFNWFTGNNTSRLTNGLALVTAGPATLSLPIPDATFAATVSEAAQELEITFDDTLEWLDEDEAGMMVRMGIPQPATRNFFDGPWRIAGTIEGDSITPPTTPATIAVPFPVQEGQIVYVQGRILRADGRNSDLFRVTATVAA